MAEDTTRLLAVLPTLAEVRVGGFRNQDWCRFIDYPRGSFSNILDSDSTCNLFSRRPRAFDVDATSDFERIRRALNDSGVNVRMILDIHYDSAGEVSAAVFDLVAGEFDRFSYVYDRVGAIPKDPNPDTIVLDQIDHNWWFLSEDWM